MKRRRLAGVAVVLAAGLVLTLAGASAAVDRAGCDSGSSSIGPVHWDAAAGEFRGETTPTASGCAP